MLDKKPNKRITIKKLKSHPFFTEIDWELLYQRKIAPPVQLAIDEEVARISMRRIDNSEV